MATTATKSIAVRLPYDEFLRRLRAATEAKLSMSEYLHLKLSDGDRVDQVEAQLVALSQQVSQLQREAQEQADLFHEQACQADQQRIDLLREMKQLKQQADTNQQNQQLALEEERVQREKMTKAAGEWQTHATNLQESKTGLEQTIKTQLHTLARQEAELAQLKAKNSLLTSENQQLQREFSVVKTSLATLKEQGLSLWDNLALLQDDHLFGKMPERYWVILDEFKESLEARP